MQKTRKGSLTKGSPGNNSGMGKKRKTSGIFSRRNRTDSEGEYIESAASSPSPFGSNSKRGSKFDDGTVIKIG